jgi:hypothetical protein
MRELQRAWWKRVRPHTVILIPGALILLVAAAAGPAAAQPSPPGQKAILQYVAPTSATWGPSPAAPPTFAFGKPAQVLLVVPGGYVVYQEVPLEQAIAHATYVSGQVGQPIAVTIPDPAGGPPRVEYVGASRPDR